ncbi:MAG: TIGR03643 family protein [Melioribacteraceae bacterium]|nr:MAG: TIGR03643 family protein [Melioribacteraceae bacterium]
MKKALSEADISRIIEMAWEDRTHFEAIEREYGLTNGEVIKLMRREMNPGSFRVWRARTSGRKTKHKNLTSAKDFRFKAPTQGKFRNR